MRAFITKLSCLLSPLSSNISWPSWIHSGIYLGQVLGEPATIYAYGLLIWMMLSTRHTGEKAHQPSALHERILFFTSPNHSPDPVHQQVQSPQRDQLLQAEVPCNEECITSQTFQNNCRVGLTGDLGCLMGDSSSRMGNGKGNSSSSSSSAASTFRALCLVCPFGLQSFLHTTNSKTSPKFFNGTQRGLQSRYMNQLAARSTRYLDGRLQTGVQHAIDISTIPSRHVTVTFVLRFSHVSSLNRSIGEFGHPH